MPEEWFRRAEEDVLAARLLLGTAEVPNVVGYLVQQGIEKGIKGFLLARGIPLRRIHALDALLDDATDAEPGLERWRDLCLQATVFHLTQRYPGMAAEPLGEEQLEEMVEEAGALLDALRTAARDT